MSVASKKKTAKKPAAKAAPNKTYTKLSAKTSGKGFIGVKAMARPKVPHAKPGVKAAQPAPPPPADDLTEPVEPIPGLMSDSEMERHVGDLSPADKGRFTRIRSLLARRLGSHTAARVWLTTPGRGFDGTPLDAIRDGNADLVLDALKDQFSPSPSYA